MTAERKAEIGSVITTVFLEEPGKPQTSFRAVFW